ncbi:MAG: class I SAM-dependent methyltransferase [Candidatus Aenigmatarchaeota archaeon]
MIINETKRNEWNLYWNSRRTSKINFFRVIYFSKVFANLVESLTPGKRILEVGCGTSMILKQLMKRGFEVYGCDKSSMAIQMSRKSGIPNLKLCDMLDKNGLPYENGYFDIVFSQGVMEHLKREDFRTVLHEMKRVGKMVLIIVPSNRSIFQVFYPFGKKKDEVFFSENILHQSLSRELTCVNVKYMPSTFYLSIAGWGRA